MIDFLVVLYSLVILAVKWIIDKKKKRKIDGLKKQPSIQYTQNSNCLPCKYHLTKSKGKEASKKDDGIYAIKMARVADLNLN